LTAIINLILLSLKDQVRSWMPLKRFKFNKSTGVRKKTIAYTKMAKGKKKKQKIETLQKLV